MPMFYKLGNPAITSVSIDGFEHKVNPDTGLLEVHMMTPGLAKGLESHGPVEVNPNDKDQMADIKAAAQADEEERQILFTKLDEATNRKIDRRKSLKQVRELWADHQQRQARILGVPSPALAASLR